MSQENFKLSSTNPNDSVGGGGCLCHPGNKSSYCQGPYVIFHQASTDEPRSPHPVVSAACVAGAYRQLQSAGDDLPQMGQPTNMHEELARAEAPTVDWDDLDEEAQAAAAHFPAGAVVKVGPGQYVTVPSGEGQVPPSELPSRDPAAPGEFGLPPLSDTAESVQADREQGSDPDPLVQIAGPLPLEEPGAKPGEFVPVAPEGPEDIG